MSEAKKLIDDLRAYVRQCPPHVAERQAAQLIARAASALESYARAAPLCEEHQPSWGTRGGCLICALGRLSAALSRIDYACGEPNEQQCSAYDVHCDEDAVVSNVRSTLESLSSAKETLERELQAHGHLAVASSSQPTEQHPAAVATPLTDYAEAHCYPGLVKVEFARALEQKAESLSNSLEDTREGMRGQNRMIEAAESRLAEVEAALGELVPDAERYRWLRDKSEPNNPVCTFYLSIGDAFKDVRFKPDTVDAAIDAARSLKPADKVETDDKQKR